MFGFFKKGRTGNIRVMGHDLDVLSITRNGKVIYTSELTKDYKKDHLEGKIFEVSFPTRSGSPYFAYYLCEKYYLAVVHPGNAASFGGPNKTDDFRSAASQSIAAFLINYLKSSFQINASKDIISFSHNRAHTNVLAYVKSLDNWYPIQHSESEDDDASERKAAGVNRGHLDITNVIAVDESSPSG